MVVLDLNDTHLTQISGGMTGSAIGKLAEGIFKLGVISIACPLVGAIGGAFLGSLYESHNSDANDQHSKLYGGVLGGLIGLGVAISYWQDLT